MKIPRDISGEEIVKLLFYYGYKRVSQKGSHIKITTLKDGEYHLVIPNHNPVKIGTFNAIINQLAEHFNKSKEEILNDLFG